MLQTQNNLQPLSFRFKYAQKTLPAASIVFLNFAPCVKTIKIVINAMLLKILFIPLNFPHSVTPYTKIPLVYL